MCLFCKKYLLYAVKPFRVSLGLYSMPGSTILMLLKQFEQIKLKAFSSGTLTL